MNKHAKIFIEGIVQGVGFRPHVYNMAKTFDLRGYVLNDSRGVTIEIEGDMAVLKKFAENLRNNPPRLSDIQGFICQFSDEIAGYNDFFIKKSEDIGDKTVLISPDICVCDDCLREMEDPEDRRFAYPFINCTNCGPRYTIVTDVPYDRKNTSMADFPLCDYCKAQYEEPSNRRFHAQPVACSQCGPRLFLYDKNGNEICKNPSNIPDAAAKLLHQGKIIAIKGLGGYHLAVDAKNHSAVCILRERKYREDKPFAVMFSNVREVEEQCFVSEAEAALLSSFKAPIVLLKKRDKISLSPGVAPNNLYLGVMLAYTPMHHLILKAFQGCLVMTSGNVSDEPICYKDLFAAEHLFGIADFFLSHNRPIHIRCDDTVTRVFDGQEYLLRRSRGYAPFPIITKNFTSEPVLAVGAELKNTICIYRGNQAIFVQQKREIIKQ